MDLQQGTYKNLFLEFINKKYAAEACENFSDNIHFIKQNPLILKFFEKTYPFIINIDSSNCSINMSLPNRKEYNANETIKRFAETILPIILGVDTSYSCKISNLDNANESAILNISTDKTYRFLLMSFEVGAQININELSEISNVHRCPIFTMQGDEFAIYGLNDYNRESTVTLEGLKENEKNKKLIYKLRAVPKSLAACFPKVSLRPCPEVLQDPTLLFTLCQIIKRDSFEKLMKRLAHPLFGMDDCFDIEINEDDPKVIDSFKGSGNVPFFKPPSPPTPRLKSVLPEETTEEEKKENLFINS